MTPMAPMTPWWRPIAETLAVGLAYSAAAGLPSFLLAQRARDGVARGIGKGSGAVAMFLSGCLFAISVRPLVATLELSVPGVMLALWLLWFVFGLLLSMIEANVFTEGPGPIRGRDVLGAMVATAIGATVAGGVIGAVATGSLAGNIARWIDGFGWQELALRLLGAAVAFMVAYCVIGSIVWRFVRRYYEDPKFGLRLRVPRGSRIILLQLGRGLLAVLALTPLLASTTAHGFVGWTRFALALAVTGGVLPLLGAAGWPVYLRVAHAVEIVVFEVVYASALWWILGI